MVQKAYIVRGGAFILESRLSSEASVGVPTKPSTVAIVSTFALDDGSQEF